MCSKKALQEWLDKHTEIPDDARVMVFEYDTCGGRYYPLELACLEYDSKSKKLTINQ